MMIASFGTDANFARFVMLVKVVMCSILVYMYNSVATAAVNTHLNSCEAHNLREHCDQAMKT